MAQTDTISSGGGSSSGSSSIEDVADGYTEGGDIQFLKLMQAIVGSFAALWVAVGIEVLSVFVNLHVWAIDGFGRFLEDVVLETLGMGATIQTEAWTAAAASLEHEPMLIPFVLAAEALVLYALVAAVRDRGVVP